MEIILVKLIDDFRGNKDAFISFSISDSRETLIKCLENRDIDFSSEQLDILYAKSEGWVGYGKTNIRIFISLIKPNEEFFLT